MVILSWNYKLGYISSTNWQNRALESLWAESRHQTFSRSKMGIIQHIVSNQQIRHLTREWGKIALPKVGWEALLFSKESPNTFSTAAASASASYSKPSPSSEEGELIILIGFNVTVLGRIWISFKSQFNKSVRYLVSRIPGDWRIIAW